MSAPTELADVEVAVVTRSPRALAWQRRIHSARNIWRQFRRNKGGVFGLGVLILFILVAIFAPLLADSSGLDITTATGKPLNPPYAGFPLGTDYYGRSILTLCIWCSRISLLIGFAASLVAMVIGTLMGIASGHYTGWVGGSLSRLTEWFLVIPFLPLAIVLDTVVVTRLPDVSPIYTLIFVIGITSWAISQCTTLLVAGS